ncbi:hypothetical protein PRK78_006446 [Emydomyces testavorans]|uniref:Uncharacterized protein n=1 Tax=Emydomyces testavorans TaxID=2070801 RepID=A0AAF0IKU5_9EURO|nr:hypothetical protein PRK78_006446 [Emydomyces testavorans]
MASNPYSHTYSPRRSVRLPDPPRSDQDVEEIQREFPPGSQYYRSRAVPGGETIYYEQRKVVARPSSTGPRPSRRRPDHYATGYRRKFTPSWEFPAVDSTMSEADYVSGYRSRSRPGSTESRSATPRPHRRHQEKIAWDTLGAQSVEYAPYSRSQDGYDVDPKYASRHDRRSRSEQRNGLKELASAGILVAAGKTAYDYYRSRPRGRSAHSHYPSDDRSPSRSRFNRARADSISDYSERGYDPSDDGYFSDAQSSFRQHSRRGRTRSLPESGYLDNDPDQRSGYSSDSSSSVGSSEDEARTRRKLLRRELVTAGLATVATIHAGHGLYASREKRKERLKKLKEGKISEEEARNERLKGNLKDAANLSLAALGIKKTVDEWKEAAKHHSEFTQYRQKCKHHAQKRAKKRAQHSSSSVDSMR